MRRVPISGSFTRPGFFRRKGVAMNPSLTNSTSGLIIITDVKIAGKSIIGELREQSLRSGKLEDDEDDITLLPNEAMTFAGDQIEWLEL